MSQLYFSPDISFPGPKVCLQVYSKFTWRTISIQTKEHKSMVIIQTAWRKVTAGGLPQLFFNKETQTEQKPKSTPWWLHSREKSWCCMCRVWKSWLPDPWPPPPGLDAGGRTVQAFTTHRFQWLACSFTENGVEVIWWIKLPSFC